MPYENKDTGILWDDPKQMTSKAGTPYLSYTGSANVDGKEYWINAFKNEITTKGGKKVMAYKLSFKPKVAKANSVDNPF